MRNASPFDVLATLPGTLAVALAKAIARFQETNLPLEAYTVTVLREGETLIVTFTDKDAPAGGRGSPGQRPGFEVMLDQKSLTIIESQFIR